MRRAKRTIVILGLALAGCQGPVTLPVTVTPHVVPVRILVTTAAYPLLQDVAAEYRVPGTLLAINSVIGNWATIQTRLLAELEAGVGSESDASWYALTTFLPPDFPPSFSPAQSTARGLWVAPVGRDGIAIIVHPTNSITALTLADLRQLMTGEITNWSGVGGTDSPVVVVIRESGADTHLAFDASVLHGHLPPGSARLALSSARMVEIVAQTPGAIGYVSMGWLADQADQLGVRIVPLAVTAASSPVLPDPTTVSTEHYPLHTLVMIVGVAPPTTGSALYDWFAWIQSEAGQQIVMRRYGAFFTEPEKY